MSNKSFWNVNKEKKQIFFLYHFLNLAKGELEKQIDEQWCVFWPKVNTRSGFK